MSTYVISGVARGIGFEFVRQLSANPANTVFGLVRDKGAADKKYQAEGLSRKNIHILQADVTDYDALKATSEYVSGVTGGKLDYIIANHGAVSDLSAFDNLSNLAKDPVSLEQDLMESIKINVLGTISMFNLFMPLVLKGNGKKAIAISTGMADVDLVAKYDVQVSPTYAISKAALNMAVAKLSAVLREQGILLMTISPGFVDTGNFNRSLTPEQQKSVEGMVKGFARYAPHFKGAITPEESVRLTLSVLERSSIEAGDAGSWVSHYGNKQWL
ncbi:hypothetical protein JX266_004697 [Neoarthrinium moseri]|nr:hypothetical protein JX266_004697 [Neoarthrinium moseri]